MEDNIKRVKKILVDEDLSCVLVGQDKVFRSKDRGVKPLLDLIRKDEKVEGYVAADTVVGRAAALLYIKLGVIFVYGKLMSKKAVEIFEENGIDYEYMTLVEYIKNRDGKDLCPLEKSVWDIHDSEKGYIAICETARKLMANKFT